VTENRNTCAIFRGYGATCSARWSIPTSLRCEHGTRPTCRRPRDYNGANQGERCRWAGSLMTPNCAIVLAAGLGTRMRPYVGNVPKPLVQVHGKPLIDYALDRLAEAGIECVVVNVHYLADTLERHLVSRKMPRVVISDERGELLGTGGGIAKALPKLGNTPFFLINSDTFWLDGIKPNLARLAKAFDRNAMDALLLLAPTTGSIGYSGRGDFAMAPDGRLRRRAEREVVPFVYAGAAILSPALFTGAPTGAFPLTLLFDRAAEHDRLFGLRLEGLWMHVGTPEAVAAAEAALAAAI
jgi:MurNAc alpha-1-phosphate uridylyltransferase